MEREVGQDQVDAGLLDVGEQHPAVDDQQLAVVLEDGHVAADRAEPAERDDPQAALGQRRRRVQLEIALGWHQRARLQSGTSAPAAAGPRAQRGSTSVVGRVDQRRTHRPGGQAVQRSAPP